MIYLKDMFSEMTMHQKLNSTQIKRTLNNNYMLKSEKGHSKKKGKKKIKRKKKKTKKKKTKKKKKKILSYRVNVSLRKIWY